MDLLDDVWIVSEVMEQRNSINHNVELLNGTCFLDQLCLLTEEVHVFPHQEIHSIQRIEKAVSFFNSKNLWVVFIHLPLVVELYNHLQLLHVGSTFFQLLVHVLLSQRNVVLQICKVILTQHVVPLCNHTFHYMISNKVFWILSDLHDALFHVIVKVPRDNSSYSLFMIFHFNLQPVFIDRLNDFNHFNAVTKVGIHVSDLFPVNLAENKIWQILFPSDLFLVWNQFSKLDILASMDNN